VDENAVEVGECVLNKGENLGGQFIGRVKQNLIVLVDPGDVEVLHP
jgi:hypothetical protein